MTSDTTSIDQQAKDILQGNDRGTFTVPTHGLYPFQWNWDSMFTAWGIATWDLERAWVEAETLLASQWDCGMVPHIIFHEGTADYFPGPDVWGAGGTPPTSGITQPPVAATMMRSLYNQDKAFGRARMEAGFDKLAAWHRWFMETRAENGMIAIIHPWESGRDNALDWDKAMAGVEVTEMFEYKRRDTSHVDADMRPKQGEYDRYLTMVAHGRKHGWSDESAKTAPFRVADPGMTFILLRACRDLLALAEEFARDTTEIEGWITILEGGVRNHWNPEGFYDSVTLSDGSFAGALSNASVLCWYAGIENAQMLDHLRKILDNVTYGVPSLDPRNPGFEPLRYWRGPVWAMQNALIGIGLDDMGHTDLGTRLRENTRDLLSTHGFNEYFSPVDGTPAGGATFSWTAAVWLTWAGPNAKGGF